MRARWFVAGLGVLFGFGCAGEIGDSDVRTASPRAGLLSGSDASGSGGSRACGEAGDARFGPSLALTDRQLRNTLAALFPFEVNMPELPARPRRAHGFSTNTLSNQFTLNQAARMADAAESIAAQAHDHLDSLLPCSLSEGESCARRFIDDFGARAYRRPLEAAEAEGLLAVYRGLVADGISPEVSTSAVIAAVLQSPQFLYQLDLGEPGDAAQTYRLTSHEVAAHLSYLIVDGPPDAALRRLSQQGELLDRAVVRAQAQRLLDEPRGQVMVKRFVAEWFDVDDVDYSTRLDPALADALASEVDRNLDAWLFETPGFSVPELLTSSTTFVNRSLAEHYGLAEGPASDADWQQVQLPPHYQGGLLTKGLIAARHANLDQPSVIRRGVFVLSELLCASLGAPPDNAVDLNPRLPPGSLPRERSEARVAMQPCGSCHSVIDPVGLGMEELDQLGRFRMSYDSGAAVDNLGELYLLDTPRFAGTAELAQAIGQSDRFLSCAAEQWSEYVFGEAPAPDDCTVQSLSTAAREGDASVRELIVGLIESEAFVARAREHSTGAGP